MDSYKVRGNIIITDCMTETGPGIPAQGTARVPFYLRIALLFLLICLDALVAKFVVFSFTVGPGISFLYIVVAVMIVTTLWFGMYGAIAAYAGCWLGSGILSGLSPEVSFVWSIADLLQVIIPLFAFRLLGADVSLKTRRDLLVFVLFGIVLNNLAGAVWGTLSLYQAGLVTAAVLPLEFFTWFVGNIILTAVIVTPVLWFFTPVIRRHELFVARYWN